jgi:hypothetical protein
MFKLLKDMLTDEYGADFDLTNVATVVGYFNGMILYDLSLFTHLIPGFTLLSYAGGYASLIAAIVACQQLKPKPIVPSVAQEFQQPSNTPPTYQPQNVQPLPPQNGSNQ